MTRLQTTITILTFAMGFQLFGQSAMMDTAYIFKDTAYGKSQTIFIDNNPSSGFYEKISRFHIQHFDNDSYRYSTDYLKEKKLTLIKSRPILPWKHWVTLKQYKNQFYAYHPCDFLYHFKQSVNDTTFIDWTGEGPVANKIIKQKKIDDKTYLFKLTGIYDPDRTIIIHIINPKNGIAVFEQINNGTDKHYYLMIQADKIKSVPIIVNNCPVQKQGELHFDETDYELLITRK